MAALSVPGEVAREVVFEGGSEAVGGKRKGELNVVLACVG